MKTRDKSTDTGAGKRLIVERLESRLLFSSDLLFAGLDSLNLQSDTEIIGTAGKDEIADNLANQHARSTTSQALSQYGSPGNDPVHDSGSSLVYGSGNNPGQEPGHQINSTTGHLAANTSPGLVRTVSAVTDDAPTALIVTHTQHVQSGFALNHDGGNDANLVVGSDGTATGIGGLSAMTVELDFSLADANGHHVLLSWAATDPDGNDLLIQVQQMSGLVYVEILLNGSANQITTTAQDYGFLMDGNRHQLAFSWDNANGDWSLYADGHLRESGTGFAVGQTLNGDATTGSLMFGQRQNVPGGGFQTSDTFRGIYHDVRIFNDVRTADEVSTNVQSELPHNEPGLIANWKFNQLALNGLVSESVHANNLLLKKVTDPAFSSGNPELILRVDESAADGTAIGTVTAVDAEREALIQSLLAGDADLTYDATAGKFYKSIVGEVSRSSALSAATNSLLNDVAGQLPVIESAHENDLVQQLIASTGENGVWLSGSDSAVSDEWRWGNGVLFYLGGVAGSSVGDAYVNFAAAEPSGGTNPALNYQSMQTNGQWYDSSSSKLNTATVVEWNADAVLDSAGSAGAQPIVYTIQSQSVPGAFAVDASSGEITVADGTLLDLEASDTHTVVVRATDVSNNIYEDSIRIRLNDIDLAGLSSGIDLNTDGGNDAYLMAADGGAIVGGLSQITLEAKIAIASALQPATNATILSYAEAGQSNELVVALDPTGKIAVSINGVSQVSAAAFPQLFDGKLHDIALSWDGISGQAFVYVDGEMVQRHDNFAQGHTIVGGGQLVFGQKQGSPGGGYHDTLSGTIYDIRIWAEARTEIEMALGHQRKVAGDYLPSSLVANWQMDGLTGTGQIADLVGGNDLSVGHAVGPDFTASTPVERLKVTENSATGTSAGFVVPVTDYTPNDLAGDGSFSRAGATTNIPYTAGDTIAGAVGSWSVVSGDVSLRGDWAASPLQGTALSLNGSQAGAVELMQLQTEIGKEYQVVFALTGDFQTTSSVDLRVSAASKSADYTVAEPANWAVGNLLWEHRSFTFTATSTITALTFESLTPGGQGPVISDVQVVDLPDAIASMLSDDPALRYNAATAKFYKYFATPLTYADAQTYAATEILNGVTSRLVTILSPNENAYIANYIGSEGVADVHLGGSDAAVEGEWRWSHNGQQFSGIAGEGINGSFVAWNAGEPNNTGSGEDFLGAYVDGTWNDGTDAQVRSTIVEWDASEVLSGFTFSLTDNAGGRFAIDNTTGELTVANGSLLDYEAGTSHNVTVAVTDATGEYYSEVVPVAVGNAIEISQTVPASQLTSASTPIVFSSANGNAITVSDTVAERNTRLQVKLSTNQNGTLTLSQTNGVSVEGGISGSNFMVFHGSESDINAALEGLTFNPIAGYVGPVTVDVSVSLEADQTGYYEFDGNTNDSSVGLVQIGSLIDNATLATDSIRGPVLGLDGNTDAVQIASLFSNPEDVTVASWVNIDTSVVGNNGDIVSLGDSFVLGVDNTGQIQFKYFDGSYHTLSTGVTLPSGWHHVAASFDDQNKSVSVYLDGVALRTAPVAGSISYTLGADTVIGNHGNSGIDADVGGLLDDVRIYSRTLAADEVAALAQNLANTADSVAINVQANEAPLLDNTGDMVLPAINEDSSATTGAAVSEIVLSAGGDRITDPNPGAVEGIALIAADASNGRFQYKENTGGSWTDVGPVAQSNALLLSSDSQLRFIPAADYNGPSGEIEFHAWDRTNTELVGDYVNISATGGQTVYSDATETASLTVLPVNDLPVIDLDADNSSGTTGTGFDTTFTEGEGPVALTDGILLEDIDSTIQKITIHNINKSDGADEVLAFAAGSGSITSTSVSAFGILILQNDGSATNSDFRAVLNSLTYDNVSISPNPNTRVISFVVDDGSGDPVIAFAKVAIDLDTTAPTSVQNNSITVNEGDASSLIQSNNLQYTDAAAAESVNYTITSSAYNGFLALTDNPSVPVSNFTQADIDADNLVYTHDGSQTTDDSFTFTVDDGRGNSVSNQQYAIVVTPVNDAPVIGTNKGAVVKLGGKVTLDQTMLGAVDPDDSGVGLIYTINSVSNGRVENGTGNSILSFTQADLDNADVFFSHNGLSATAGSFEFTLIDGGENGVIPVSGSFLVTTYGAMPDSYSTDENTVIEITAGSGLLANDADGVGSVPPGVEPSVVSTDTSSILGVVTVAADGSFQYSPDQKFEYLRPGNLAIDSFDYNYIDGAGNQDTATVTVTINGVNDAPSLVTNGMAVVESSSGNIINSSMISGIDVDDTASELSFLITANVADGELVLSGSTGDVVLEVNDVFSMQDIGGGLLSYRHYGGEDATDNFVVVLSDGGEDAAGTQASAFNIDVSQINDTPVLDSSAAMALTSINEDDVNTAGDTVSAILAGASVYPITDPDPNALEGIALIAADTSYGYWQYKVAAVDSWTTVGSVAIDNALLLNADSLLRYVPDSNYNGSSGNIEFKAWDKTSSDTAGQYANTSTGDTAYSIAAATASVQVLAVGDAPVLLTSADVNTYFEDSSSVIVNPGLVITDADGPSVAAGELTIQIANNGQLTDQLTIVDGAGLTLSGNTLFYNDGSGNTSIATYTGGSGPADTLLSVSALTEPLVITFSANTDLSIVQAVARQVGFQALDQSPSEAQRTITYQLNDGARLSNVAQASVNVVAVNDAPVLDIAGLMVLAAVDEDTVDLTGTSVATIIASAGGDRITDADANSIEGIAIHQLDALDGDWQYSTNNGGNWVQVGAVSPASALLLDELSRLRFLPVADFNGTAQISFVAWDQTSGIAGSRVALTGGGGTEPFSIATETAQLSVLAVNDQPVLLNNTLTISEGGTVFITPAELSSSDVDNTASQLVFTATSVAGGHFAYALSPEVEISTFSQAEVNNNQVVFVHNGGEFAPAYQINVSDGSLGVASDADIVFTNINDAPTGTDGYVNAIEDTPYEFSVDDFGFVDSQENHQLLEVIITTLPVNGELKLANNPLMEGDTVLAAQIDSGDLKFMAEPHQHGNAYTEFQFRVRDDGGTGSTGTGTGSGTGTGGTDLAAGTNTIVINVAAVSDAPAGQDNTLTLYEDTDHTFESIDFGFTDVHDNDSFAAVVISSGPTAGTVWLRDDPVTSGQPISIEDIDNGYLRFLPDPHQSSVAYSSLDFRVQDSGSGNNIDETERRITFDVLPVNDAPAGKDNTVVTGEDIPYPFKLADFGFSDIHDGHTLRAITIDTLPLAGSGRLTLNGIDLVGGTEVSFADIESESLAFVPAVNQHGVALGVFQFRVQDTGDPALPGDTADIQQRTLSIDVLPLGNSPSGADNRVVTQEDTPHVFAETDFGFSDALDGNNFSAVRVTTLPTLGKLTLAGAQVEAGDSISIADISMRSFIYTPDANDWAQIYTSFTFQVQDDGFGPNTLDVVPKTMEIGVASVNDAPAGTDKTIGVLEDTVYFLSQADFGYSDPIENDPFESVVITSLPEAGELTLDGLPVNALDVISTADIGADLLQYRPDQNAHGSNYSQIGFLVRDAAGTDNGGINTDLLPNTLTLDVTSINDAPLGQDNVITTSGPYTFSEGDFGFSDPEDGDTFAGISVTSVPAQGTLVLDFIPVEPGIFVSASELGADQLMYLPQSDTDNPITEYFGFRVHDTGGTQFDGVDIDSDDRIITINVPATNNQPQLDITGATLDEGSSITINADSISAVDSDDSDTELFFTLTTAPANGMLTLDGAELPVFYQFDMQAIIDGRLGYIHNGSETDSDWFTVELRDGGEDGSLPVTGRFNLLINEVIDPPPVINPDSFTVARGESFDSGRGDVLDSGYSTVQGNDVSSGTDFVVTIETQPRYGTVTLNSDGTFNYVQIEDAISSQNSNPNGSDNNGQNLNAILLDEFVYRVTNVDGVFALATVQVVIEPQIQAAVAAPTEETDSEPSPGIDTDSNAHNRVDNSAGKNRDSGTEAAVNAGGQPYSASAVPVSGGAKDSTDNTAVDTVSVLQPVYFDSQSKQQAQSELDTIGIRKHKAVRTADFTAENEGISLVSFDIQIEIPPIVQTRYPTSNTYFMESLELLEQELFESEHTSSQREKLIGDSAIAVSISASAGVLSWLLRGGSLLGSVIAAVPLWSQIDPLRLVQSKQLKAAATEESDDDVVVESIFDE